MSANVRAFLYESKCILFQGGYRKYRDMLANTSLPAVPYFGVFLRDLTQIVEYNPDYVRGGLINLAKRRLVGAQRMGVGKRGLCVLWGRRESKEELRGRKL